METISKQLIEEKFKNMHTLFETNFNIISDKLDEVIKHQKITNGRVTSLETKDALNTQEKGQIIELVTKVADTLDRIDIKVDSLEKSTIVNDAEHLTIKTKLEEVSNCVDKLKKRGIGFWLWLSENKLRLVVLFIPAILAIFPSTREALFEFLKSILTKIF